MLEPRPSIMRLAKTLVDAGHVRDENAAPAMVRLHASLAKLVGEGGFDVLLRRSLALARREHSVLVDVVAGEGGELHGLSDPSRDRVAVERAEAAIVGQFIELLVVLIGEELTMSLLEGVRQDALNGAPAAAKDVKE